MYTNVNEVIEVVQQLNDELEVNVEGTSENFFFVATTNGYCSDIRLLGNILWSSENDGREINNDVVEPLMDFVKKEAKKMVNNLVEHGRVL